MIRKICNTGYFLPAVLGLLFYGTIALSGGFFSIHPLAWCFVALLFLCAVWMRKQKWWGCLGGILTGGVLIYMGTQYTGQVINESILGISLCAYYLLCGWLCRNLKTKG